MLIQTDPTQHQWGSRVRSAGMLRRKQRLEIIRHMRALRRATRLALATAVIAAAPVAAEEDASDSRVAVETAWSVFVEDEPRECWVVSGSRSATHRRNNQGVNANRGSCSFGANVTVPETLAECQIYLFATFRPGNDEPEISYTAGYPYADGSTVSMTIGSDEFELFTDGSWAWAASPEDDARISAAMRRGAEAVLESRSGRGTVVTDTFSLFGFTAASEEAQRRCAE